MPGERTQAERERRRQRTDVLEIERAACEIHQRDRQRAAQQSHERDRERNRVGQHQAVRVVGRKARRLGGQSTAEGKERQRQQ